MNVQIPDYQTLMLPLLRIAAEGEKKVADVEDKIADVFCLDNEQREAMLPSGRQRVLHNRIHWAKFYMSKAGLLSSPARGRFIATKSGKELLGEDLERIDLQLLMRYAPFRDFYVKGGAEKDPEISQETKIDVSTPKSTPEEQIESAFQALQSALRAEIIDRVLQNSPAFFEKTIIELLVAMGYGGSHKNAAAQLGRSGDGGVDGVINEDRLGLDRVYVQAKRYARENNIGRPDVQGFVGSLVGLGATKGIFVTTSSFSAQAQAFVKHLSQRIILLDGEQLADLMIEHDVGVRTSRALSFKRLDEDFFVEGD